jgi:hypothetical protein
MAAVAVTAAPRRRQTIAPKVLQGTAGAQAKRRALDEIAARQGAADEKRKEEAERRRLRRLLSQR